MPRGRKDFVARMSIWKQAILCLVLVVGAAAGWYVYKNPDIVGLSREDARGSGKPEASGKSERGGEQAGSRQERGEDPGARWIDMAGRTR